MIGVIADDATGATDVAAALSRAGLRTILALRPFERPDRQADAIVVALKSRSTPAARAISDSLGALAALRRSGCTRFYFKYCSTVDSTSAGNIGPVTEALAQELGAAAVVTTPAAPIHGRTVYCGHLFVNGQPLHETHMRDHPITPMRDSSLPRLLAPQVNGTVLQLPLATLRGDASTLAAVIEAEAEGISHIVADAVDDGDLAALATAVHAQPLVAGSAGLIAAMARREARSVSELPSPPAGRTAIIAGSCSRRTLEQISRFQQSGRPSFRVAAGPGDTAESLTAAALSWWDSQPVESSALIYSSTPADQRDDAALESGQLYEQVAGALAVALAGRGVQRLLVAGGETSGEVMRALGTSTAVVGAEAAVGAPWITDAERDMHLVLKSGNFGTEELFIDVAATGETQ
ncbi:MAG: 3-oxo-tetronate kinase [Beutenbergiaceae bacterium]